MSPAPVGAFLRGHAPSRLPNRRLLIIFGVGFAVIVGAAILGAVIAESTPPKPACKTIEPCGEPPKPVAPLVSDAVYRSPKLGYQLEYSTERWNRSAQTDDSRIVLDLKEVDAELVVEGVPADQGSPRDLLGARRDSLRDRLFAFSDDTDPLHEVLGPELALHEGVAGSFVGEVDTPQGVRAPLQVILMAAGNASTSVLATVVMSQADERNRRYVMANADVVLNSLRLRVEALS
jgi:hypothetical protein